MSKVLGAAKPSLAVDKIQYEEPAPQMSFEQVKEVFAKFDRDGSGMIDEAELQLVLMALNKPCQDEDIKKYLAQGDLDGDGNISLSEFCVMVGIKYEGDEEDPRVTEAEILKECFAVFDSDGSGYIERHEMMNIMCNLGTASFAAPSEETVDALLAEADIDGDGKISYNEFVRVMQSSNSSWA